VVAKQMADQCREACPCTLLSLLLQRSRPGRALALTGGACRRTPSPRRPGHWAFAEGSVFTVLPNDATVGQLVARRLDRALRFPVSSIVPLKRRSIRAGASRHSRGTSLACQQLLDEAAGDARITPMRKWQHALPSGEARPRNTVSVPHRLPIIGFMPLVHLHIPEF
jgi:hypothetical protein